MLDVPSMEGLALGMMQTKGMHFSRRTGGVFQQRDRPAHASDWTMCLHSGCKLDGRNLGLFDAAMGNREVRNDGLELAAERTDGTQEMTEPGFA